MNLSFTYLISILVLIIYAVASKNIKRLPSIPLGLLIISLLLRLLVGIIEGYSWSDGWASHLLVAADVVLAWAVAHIVFWFLMVVISRFKEEKDIPPKITRDFIMFLTFVILLLIVLRIRSDVNLASLLTTSAILTVIMGLAAQATLSNFFSGLILQAERPFALGDWISLNEHEGRVVGISWKSTQILTRLQELVYIPNSILASSTFYNYSKPTRKKIARLFIGLEYGVPPNKVEQVVIQALGQNSRVLKRPRAIVRVTEFGDFAITYEIRFWHKSFAYEPQLKADINRQLWYALKRNNIRIPFPIRDVFHGHIERRYNRKQELDLRGEIDQILSNVPILSPLSDSARADLSKRVGIELYGTGELIVQEGEAGDSMYIIRSGACRALRMGQQKRMKLLRTMHRGDFFGEISLLTGDSRSATIEAIEDTSLIVIDKKVFSSVMDESPVISEEIARVVFDRQQEKGVLIDELNEIDTSREKFVFKIKRFFGI